MKKRIVLLAAILVLLLAFLGLQTFASDRAVSTSAIATWAAAEPAIDGNANEADWLIYNDILGAEGTPVGAFGKLWRGENLYLAVNTGGASSMSLTLNTSYTLTVNLSGTATASGMQNVVVKKNGNTVEMKIPFASFGFTLHNYTDTVPMSLSLTNASGTSSFGGSLGFSSRMLANKTGNATQGYNTYHPANYGSDTNVPTAIANGQLGYTSTADANGIYTYRMWNIYQEGKENYGVQWLQSTAITRDTWAASYSGNVAVDFDLNIADMPEYRQPAEATTFFRQHQASGLGVYFGNNGNGEFNLVFSHLKGTGLVLYVGHGPLTKQYGTDTVQWDGPYKLNKELGETFHVTLHGMEDHTLAVFVDDTKIYDYKDSAWDFPLMSGGLGFHLRFPYYAEGYTDELVNPNGSPKSAAFNSDVYISNVQVGSLTEENILDLVDFDAIRGANGAENFINTNLTLPPTVSDGRLTSALTWSSSNGLVITNSGEVTTREVDKAVTLTAIVNKDSKQFALTVTRPTVDAWYSESITMDGAANEYHSFQRGYAFDGNTALAARWNKDKVYLALKHANATKLTLAIGNKTLVADLAAKTVSGVDGATIAVGSGVAEIAIPRSVFGEKSQELVATVTGSTTLSKALILEFFGKPASGIINYGGTSAIAVDGKISELPWQLYTKTQGRKNSPQGRVGKLWTGDSLYLAVYADDAKTMKLTVGGKSTTVDLETLTDSGNLLTTKAKSTYTTTVDGKVKTGTLVEMRIAYSKFGFSPYNYGATIPVSVELENERSVSGYTGTWTITNTSWKGYAGNVGNPLLGNQMSSDDWMHQQALRVGHIASETTALENTRYAYHMWNKYYSGPETAGYAQSMRISNNSAHLVAKEGTVRVDFDVRIDAMEAYDKVHHAHEGYGNNGLNMGFGRGLPGNDLKIGISRLKNGGLVLVHHNAYDSSQTPYPLNRELGEDFHISLRWEEDGDVAVYVDDELLTFIEKAGGAFGTAEGDAYMLLLSKQTWYKAKSSDEDIDYTVSNLVYGTEGTDNLMDSLTFDSFKGSNRNESNVSADMTLPTSLTDGKLTTQLTWTSSNTSAISISGGKATVAKVTADTPVTLTATLTGSNPAVTKTFQLVVRRPVVASGLLTEGSSVTVDGTHNSAEYPSDSFYKLPYSSLDYTLASRWDRENIYIAFKSAYSWSGMPDTLVLTFGSKTATVSLSNGSVTGITGATGAAKGGSLFTAKTVEVCIPRSALGVDIPSYYHNVDFTVAVKRGSSTHVTLPMRMEFCGYDSIAEEYIASATFNALKNALSTVEAYQKLATAAPSSQKYTISYDGKYTQVSTDIPYISATVKSGAIKLESKYSAGIQLTDANLKDAANLTFTGLTSLHTVAAPIVMEMDMNIAKMPVFALYQSEALSADTEGTLGSSGAPYRNHQGVYFQLTTPDAASTGEGDRAVAFTIVNKEGGLYLESRQQVTAGGKVLSLALGKQVGQQFKLRFELHKQDIDSTYSTLYVYVDGAYVGKLSAVRENYVSGSTPALMLGLHNLTEKPTADGSHDIDVTITNLIVGQETNVNLPTSYTSQYVDGSINLSWKSDTPRILADSGVITYKDKEDALVRLTVSSEGKTLSVLESNVKSKYGKDLAVNANIQVPFANNITIDGTIAEQGWSINTNLTDGNSVVGKLGTAWNADNLYLAINPGTASSVTVTLEDKTSTINLSSLSVTGDLTIGAKAKGSTYLELQIPLSQFDMGKVQNYGQKLSGEVVAGNGKATLNMTLSSLQYFATDNPEHRYPMTSKSGNADLANISHSVTDNGYYFYNNYEFGAENKGGGYGYVGFHNGAQAGAEIFAPMEQSGKVNLYHEMDFQAVSMPVYTGDEVVQENKLLFASNGVSWQIGGYANRAQATSHWLAMGIYNTETGLVLAVKTPAKTHRIPLGKQVGDLFRLGSVWMKDHSLLIYVDGEYIYTVDNAATVGSTVSSGGITLQHVRSADPAVCDADSIRVNVSNIAMGNYYGNNLLDNLTFDSIKGSNTDPENITSNLTLPATFGNSQLSGSTLTWTSSNESVVSSKGVVNKNFDSGYGMAVLTASDAYGNTKSFNLIVKGNGQCENVLYVERDFNPAAGVGVAYSGSYFTFDTNNRSLVYVLDSKQPVNVVKLTELDSNSRIYEDMLTLWYSDDNKTYTEVKDFKLLHLDNSWYVYGFNVEAKYIKLHSTHFDSEECMVEGFFPDMIRAYHEDVFGDNGKTFTGTKTATVSNTEGNAKVDYPFQLDMAGLGLTTTNDIRVYLGDELLYHYVEDGKLYVRIPRVAAGGSVSLTILSGNADAMDIANKEAVYEVIYGTREGGLVEKGNPNTDMRIMYTLPDGTIIKMTREGRYRYWGYSTDSGRTWVEKGSATSYTSRSSAGYHKGYAVGGFVYDDVGNVLYTYGYGMPDDTDPLTQMHMHKLDMKNGLENAKWEYVGQIGKELYDRGISISNYNHGTTLSCSDGEGPNVDMLFAVSSSGEYDGDAGADRVFYTTDGGKTWLLSESRITFPSMQAGFEMGVSEPTTLELEDGTVVMLARYQAADSISFAYSESKDHGITWSVPVASEVYSSNTQPMFHETRDDFDLFVWAGNNQHGGTSYQRYPMNVAIPVAKDGNMAVTAVQDMYSKYVWQGMAWDNTRNTNLYLTHAPDGALLIAWYMPMPNDLSYFLRVDDYQDVVLKTKGAYDSFERGSLKYEGWSSTAGTAGLSNAYSTDGDTSLQMYGTVVRSLPYFRKGSVSFDVYWEAGKTFKMELQTSHNNNFGAASPVSFAVDSLGNVSFGGTDSGLRLHSGWNAVNVELNLPAQEAAMSINGGTKAAMPIHKQFNEYVCYVSLHADSFVYIDNFINIGDEAPIYDHACVAGEPVEENRVEATCTTAGSYERVVYCSDCGKEISRETVEIPKLGHKPEVLPAVPATCTTTGLTQGMKCSVCDAVLVSQKPVEKVPHTEVTIPGKAATCTEAGLTDGKKCSVCNEILEEQTVIAKTGHKPVVDPKVEPTCTATGLTQGMHCSICGKVLVSQSVIAKLDHDYGYANITDETHDKVCSVGGESVTEEHTYTDGFCVCGAEEPAQGPVPTPSLKFVGNYLSFQEYIGMQTMLQTKLVKNYTKVYVKATQTPVGGVASEPITLNPIDLTSSYKVFDMKVMAWDMTDTITMTLYAEDANGVVYEGQTVTATVEALALEKLAQLDGTNEIGCRVLVDMLNYGAAVQTAYDHNASSLPNTKLGEFVKYATTGDITIGGEVTSTGTATGVTDGGIYVSMQAQVELTMLIKPKTGYSIENMEMRVTPEGGETRTFDHTTFKMNGSYYVPTIALKAADFRTPHTLAIYDKTTGAVLSKVHLATVEAKAAAYLAVEQYKPVVENMMKYGDAVAAMVAGQ